MKAQRTSVQVRHSNSQADGAYKTLELGAEAALGPQWRCGAPLGRAAGGAGQACGRTGTKAVSDGTAKKSAGIAPSTARAPLPESA